MKAYLDKHRGKLVASLTEKPNIADYAGVGCFALKEPGFREILQHKRDMKDYEANLMEVENVVSMRGRERLKISVLYYTIYDIPPGQQVEIEITETGCKVKSLI